MSAARPNHDTTLQVQRVLKEIEEGIRVANREIIHESIPELSRDSLLAFSVAVGRLRAAYLKEAFQMCVAEPSKEPDSEGIRSLREKRELFDEARLAYDALLHAIEREYIVFSELNYDDEGRARA